MNDVHASAETETDDETEFDLDFAESFYPGTETISGDLRDAFLEVLRHRLKKPWPELLEWQQVEVANQINAACIDAVRQIVDLVSAHGLPVVQARLSKAVVKSGKDGPVIEGTVSLPGTHEQRHELLDAVGHIVSITLADPMQFIGARAAPPIDPDEPGLPLQDPAPAAEPAAAPPNPEDDQDDAA